MRWGQVELHNVEESLELPGKPGVLLQRLPESVRVQLNEGARNATRRAAGVEIRFVNEGDGAAVVSLASYQFPSKVYVYAGSHYVAEYQVGEEPVEIEAVYPSPGFTPWVIPEQSREGFAPKVWRLIPHGGEVHLLDVRGDGIRPPHQGETPELTYLAYGTSITYGASALTPDLSYIRQAAGRLGLDVLNLGMPGAAHCEAALADHIAGRKDWDIASLCMSINMLNQSVPADEFREKASYMAMTVASRNPGKPVVCISLFPSFADLGHVWPGRNPQATPDEYREVLRSIVAGSGLSNLHYVDGRALLTSYSGLSHDLLHPGNNGMIEIGERLADYIRQQGLLEQLKGQGRG
ncbi:MAG: hypothetical protein K0R57_5937 [Paenibacillaceae bacterium]|jgi:hypothetical protein|nr:hypothetical protein [Paenibacillaceae bacterium]